MSAERYEIIDQGCRVKIICPDGSVECFDPSTVGVPNLDDVAAGTIRQQARDIAELETDVAGLRSSEAVLKFDCDQLRGKLAEMVGRSKASRDDLHRSLGRTDDTIIQLEHELSLSRLATERHKTHIAQCGEELKTIRADLAAAVAERNALTDVLYRSGFTKCDIPACNCGSWHHRYGLPERMREIKDELSDADHPCGNSNGWLPINALRQLIAERDTLRARLAAIDGAPTLCWQDVHDLSDLYWRRPDPAQVDTRELIARPAKD